MIRIEVKTDFHALEPLRALPAALRNRVLARTLNEVGKTAQVQARKEIAEEFNIPSREVGSMLFLTRAKARGQEISVQVGALSRRGRSLNLIRFVERSVTLAQARKRRKAGTLDLLRVKVRRAGGLKILGQPHWAEGKPFVMTNRRTGGTFVGAREPGGRVRGVQTIDVPSMFNTKRLTRKLIGQMRADFQTTVARQIAAALRGY